VSRAGIALLEGGGRRLLFTSSDRSIWPTPEWCHVDGYDDVPLNTAVRSRRPVTGSLTMLGADYPEFVQAQDPSTTAAVAAYPIADADEVLGGFVLYYDAPQPFDRAQHEDLTTAAETLGRQLGQTLRVHAPDVESLRLEELSPDADVAFHEVPPTPAAVRTARHFLDQTHTRWRVPETVRDTAVLCLSELVTNALLHTHTGCEVRALLKDGLLTTTVRDRGRGVASQAPADDGALRVHGRGLELVELLSSDWGSRRGPVGSTVWFTLET
jgi:anti-sigma regulatory factor (Ser/Thr protein kinase)